MNDHKADNTDLITGEVYVDMSDLLAIMEQAGMAPPVITILPDSYNRSEGTYGFEVHEWEDEQD